MAGPIALLFAVASLTSLGGGAYWFALGWALAAGIVLYRAALEANDDGK